MLVVYRWCLWHLWWYSEWRVLLLFKEALALIADTSRIWCQWKSGRILGAAPCVMVAKWNEAMRNQRGLKWLQSDPFSKWYQYVKHGVYISIYIYIYFFLYMSKQWPPGNWNETSVCTCHVSMYNCQPSQPVTNNWGWTTIKALALERQHWANDYVSPLEIHEHFARDVVYGKRAPWRRFKSCNMRGWLIKKSRVVYRCFECIYPLHVGGQMTKLNT